jgi:hypothetical protein
MEECGGHQDLYDSDHQSVTPYVHRRIRDVLLCVRCLSRELNLPELELRAPLILTSARTFYNSRPDSYNETQDPTCGPGAGKILCSRALMTRSSQWRLQQCGHVWSYRLPCCTWSAVWCRAVESLGTVAVPDEWSIVLTSHCSCTVDAYMHALQVLTTLPVRTSYRRMMVLTWGVLETCTRVLGICVPSCTGRSARLFIMFETHGPQGVLGHVVALEPTLAGRWGTEP